MAIVNLRIQIDAEGNVTAIDDAAASLDRLDREGAQATARLREIEGAQQRLAVGAVAMGGAIVAASYKAAQASSDLNESVSAANQIFGESARVIHEFAAGSARDIGMSKRMTEEAAAGFGQLFQTVGQVGPQAAAEMSVATIKLASDWASFRNLRPEDTLQALRSGIVGEIEPLRRLGISFNQAQVEAKALAMGLADASGALSESAKMQARYALIVEQSAQVSGDFARTADGMANSQRIMTASAEDATAAIGDALVPAFGALAQAAVPVAELIGAIAQTPLGRWAIVAGAGVGALALAGGTLFLTYTQVRGAIAMTRTALLLQEAAVLRNTVALRGETGALVQNTVAQNANAGAARRSAAARGYGVMGAGTRAGTMLGSWGAVATGGVVGYEAAGAALRTRSTGAQSAYGAGGVLGGAAAGAAIGSIVPGVGTAVGALAGAAGAGVVGTGRMAYNWGAEVMRGRRLRAEVGAHQERLAAMSPEERRRFLGIGVGAPAANRPSAGAATTPRRRGGSPEARPQAEINREAAPGTLGLTGADPAQMRPDAARSARARSGGAAAETPAAGMQLTTYYGARGRVVGRTATPLAAAPAAAPRMMAAPGAMTAPRMMAAPAAAADRPPPMVINNYHFEFHGDVHDRESLQEEIAREVGRTVGR